MKQSDRPTKKLAGAGSWLTPDAPVFASYGTSFGLARSSSTGNLASLFGSAARESSFFPSTSDGYWSFVGDWGQPPEEEGTTMNEPVLASDLFAAALSLKRTSKNGNSSSSSSTVTNNTSEYPHKSAYKKTISCPDFSVFTAEASLPETSIAVTDEEIPQDAQLIEEMKRARRLARNRASARLRRQRKRSTIETLEHKIEKLKRRIEKLQTYSFGSGLERGSGLSDDIGARNQPLSQPKERKRIESKKYFLDNTCRDLKIILNNQVFAALMNSVAGGDESTAERRILQQELRNVLNLSKKQKGDLLNELRLKNNVAHQYTTMCALLHCATAGINGNWFDSPLHSKVTDAFLKSVTEEQNKRYMNWADRNSEAISLLSCYRPTDNDKEHADLVERAYWYSAGPRKGKPVFYFGGKGSGEFLLSCFVALSLLYFVS